MSVLNIRELQPFVVSDVRVTGRVLGEGSYGTVEEAEIPGATCVVKRLHDALLPDPFEADGADRMASTFVEECRLMSTVRHPHIVQFLGVCVLPGSRLPALIMEKLMIDLHNLLENNSALHISMKHSILLDVSRGLTYLHTRRPAIIHRDLSARNVLLNSAMVAKIADLGNSRIINVRPSQLMTMTKNPGNLWYMPPEAQEECSKYNTPIDVFSFGNVTLFTLTQKFPKVRAATYTDPITARVCARLEVERRSDSFDQVYHELGKNHPLVLLAEQCLDNLPSRRPPSTQILARLEAMSESITGQYINLQMIAGIERKVVQEKDIQLKQKEEELRQINQHLQRMEETHRLEINHLLWQHQEEHEQRQQQLASLEDQLAHLQEQGAVQVNRLEMMKSHEIELQNELSKMKNQLQDKDQQVLSMQQDHEAMFRDHKFVMKQKDVELKKLDWTMESMQQEYDSNLKKKDDELSRLNRQVQSMQHDLEAQLWQKDEDLRKMKRQLLAVQQDHEYQLRLKEDDYKRLNWQLQSARQDQEAKLQQMEEAHRLEIGRQRLRHQEEQEHQHQQLVSFEAQLRRLQTQNELKAQLPTTLIQPATEPIADLPTSPELLINTRKIASSLPSAATANIIIPRAVIGRERTVTIQARDAKGEPHPHGGEDVQATLTLMDSNGLPLGTSVHDNRDGTYQISFTTQQHGYHQLNITIEKHPIKGSPYAIYSRAARPYASISKPLQSIICSNYPWDVAVNDNSDLYISVADSIIEAFSESGSKARIIGSEGSKDGQFLGPDGIAFQGEFMYVADSWNHRVQKLTLSGSFIAKIGSTGEKNGQFSSPRGISLDHEGRVFVADTDNSRVSVFNNDGVFLYNIGNSTNTCNLASPCGLAFDISGNLHVADVRLKCVKVFSPNGEYVTEYGKGQLKSARYITINEEGFSFVSDGTISIFDPQHKLISKINCVNSRGVALDKDGHIYVANNSKKEILKF